MSEIIRNPALKIGFFCLILVLAIIVRPIFTPAGSATQLEFRITQLESQISEIRGQLYRLSSQGSGVSRPPSSSPPSSSRPNPRMLSGDPMFDNLATLAIETKQDVIKIKERLSKLESSRSQ